VVVFKGSKVFLLEATNKNRRRHWKHYPLASLVNGYEPFIMFYRISFWLNTGRPKEVGYSSDSWERRSVYRGG
jgi:hypothetical protein